MKNGRTITKTIIGHSTQKSVLPNQVSFKTKPWPRWLQWLIDKVDEMEARL